MLYATLDVCGPGVCVYAPGMMLVLRRGSTYVQLAGSEVGGRYVFVFSGQRVARLLQSVVASVERGALRAEADLALPMRIPLRETALGLEVADEFANQLLLMLYALDYVERAGEGGSGRYLILRKAGPKVVRGIIVPPADVKAILFWERGEVVYEATVGYDKRLKFKSARIRDATPGVSVLPAKLRESGGDVYLDAFLDGKVDLLRLKEPYEYIDVEEEEG